MHAIFRGTEEDILKIVRNIRKPLALGYVMVKNRSQFELNQLQAAPTAGAGGGGTGEGDGKKAVSGSVSEDEEAYFSNHPVWGREVDEDSRGSRALCRRLTALMVNKAVAGSARMRQALQQALSRVQQSLSALPEGEDETAGGDVVVLRSQWLMRAVSRFTQTLRQVSAGDYSRDPLAREPEMQLKYRVATILERLRSSGRYGPDFDSAAFGQSLATHVLEMRGRELPGFGSTRLLLTSVSSEMLCWRDAIEEALQEMTDSFVDTAKFLASHLVAGVRTLPCFFHALDTM